MISDIPEPQGPLLAWLAANPNAVKQAIKGLKKLGALQVRFGAAQSAPTGGIIITEAEQNAILTLPLAFRGSMADVPTYAGTASGSYTQAELQAVMTQLAAVSNKMNALLAELRRTGQNPSS